MSDLTDVFTSAPYVYPMMDGRTASFTRMTMDEWTALITKRRAELMAIENIDINKQVGEKDIDQRQRARYIAKEEVERLTQFRKMIHYVTTDVEGIKRLLAHAYVGSDWEEVRKLIPPTEQIEIALNIVHLPIVKSENPSTPGGNKSPADTKGRKTGRKSTGKKSAASSNTSSPELPPAA